MGVDRYSQRSDGLSGVQVDALALEAEAEDRGDKVAAKTASRIRGRIKELEDWITEGCGTKLPPSRYDR